MIICHNFERKRSWKGAFWRPTKLRALKKSPFLMTKTENAYDL